LIQEQAMRLFLERGYDETTVNEIAATAGVSPMTVYRHFPTKEDLVLRDEYDPLIADRVAARPADEPLVRRIGNALVEGIDRPADGTGDTELLLTRLRLILRTPALRARRWEAQFATQQAIVERLRGDPPDPDREFRLWVATGACLSAAGVAVLRWAEEDGRTDLARLVADALDILSDGGHS
jgi:AcrR family transcriptional regulator